MMKLINQIKADTLWDVNTFQVSCHLESPFAYLKIKFLKKASQTLPKP